MSQICVVLYKMKINVLIVVYTKRDDVCLTNACLALIVPIGLHVTQRRYSASLFMMQNT